MTLPNLDVLAYEESSIGMICLRRRELLAKPGTWVTEITIDHQLLMSSSFTASEEALARQALHMHAGSGLDVLVGGLGLGYTVRAVLDSARVARVEAVELVPQVIDWLERGLLPLAGEITADPRFSVQKGDVFARLAAPPERTHDVILVDVDHSPEERLGEADDSFYTAEGLTRAKRHLAPGGVFGVWSYAESSAFSETLASVFAEVRIESVTFRNDVLAEDDTNWLFFAR